jgi:hypothetical protein
MPKRPFPGEISYAPVAIKYYGSVPEGEERQKFLTERFNEISAVLEKNKVSASLEDDTLRGNMPSANVGALKRDIEKLGFIVKHG